MTDLDDFQSRLKALSDAYAAELPQKIRQIEAAWGHLEHGEWDEAGFQSLHRMVHSVTGSGRTFGFAMLSDAARALESLLAETVQAKAMPDEEPRNRIRMALSALQQAVKSGG
jgi:chemotaxis protein histidine kinase CheA